MNTKVKKLVSEIERCDSKIFDLNLEIGEVQEKLKKELEKLNEKYDDVNCVCKKDTDKIEIDEVGYCLECGGECRV